MGLSKLSAKCQSCPFVYSCDHKQMESVGFLPLPETQISAPVSQAAASPLAQPLLRETMEIRVNGKPVTVYKDDIEKELYRQLYKHLGIPGYTQYGA